MHSSLAGCKFCGNQKTQMDGDYSEQPNHVRVMCPIGGNRPPFVVICEACKAQGPQKPNEEQAVKHWNKVMAV